MSRDERLGATLGSDELAAADRSTASLNHDGTKYVPTPDAAATAPPQVPTPALPRQIGQYEIIAPIGAGGMGQVYRVRHVRL